MSELGLSPFRGSWRGLEAFSIIINLNPNNHEEERNMEIHPPDPYRHPYRYRYYTRRYLVPVEGFPLLPLACRGVWEGLNTLNCKPFSVLINSGAYAH